MTTSSNDVRNVNFTLDNDNAFFIFIYCLSLLSQYLHAANLAAFMFETFFFVLLFLFYFISNEYLSPVIAPRLLLTGRSYQRVSVFITDDKGSTIRHLCGS